jgi:hypothetical protein
MTMTPTGNLDDDARLQWYVCGLRLVARWLCVHSRRSCSIAVVEGVCIGFLLVSC